MLLSVVNKIVKSWIKLSGSSNVDFIEFLINPIIFWISFELTLEIVTVLLLLFSQITKEVSVVRNPTLSLPVQHSSLSSFVVDCISHGSGIELLNFVEDAVELHDRLLNFVPCFIDVTADWNLLCVSQLLELLIDELIGKREGVHFLMCFLHLLHFVGWINKDTVGFVIVHVDIHIRAWNSLHCMCWTISERLRQ